jgi:hypothetical protein
MVVLAIKYANTLLDMLDTILVLAMYSNYLHGYVG